MSHKTIFKLMIAALLGSVFVSPVFAGQEKATVCHKPGTAYEATLEIAAPAEAAHLAHGDYAGACGVQQPQGCEALNAYTPEPQYSDPYSYSVVISDLDFNPGDVIHVGMTVTNGTADVPLLQSYGGVIDSNSGSLSSQIAESFTSEEQVTWSVDYTVVDGDDADGAYVEIVATDGYTIDAINFSCTPSN